MIQLIARIEAQPGQADRLEEVIESIILPSRAEAGCLMYQAHRTVDDPNVFYFYEQWRDKEAFDAHVASIHYQTYRKKSADFVVKRSLTFLKNLSTKN